MSKYIIGFTVGDLNGIGLEVVLKTITDTRIMEFCTPVIYGSAKAVSFHRKALNLPQFNFNAVQTLEAIQPNTVNILNVWEEEVAIQLGIANEIGGKYSLKSLEAATNDLVAGKIQGMVTAPINKHNIQSDAFKFPGQTEYLTKKANATDALMMMVSEDIRLGLVTNHLSVSQIAGNIKQDLILKKLDLLKQSLTKDFGIDKPRIAILSLNPHAGDKGLIGDEELKEIIPAIQAANKKNILAFGPYSADGFFGSGEYQKFDGILAMYHDQGLIPFKTISFHSGVDYTAGLPFVRTSPDHGTGFDIAGRNLASEDSMRSALYLCLDVLDNRGGHADRTSNPIKRHELTRERH